MAGSPQTNTPGTAPCPTGESEVVDICRNLLRIDTSNYGHEPGKGERDAAEYVADLLSEVGLDVEVIEPAPRRTSIVTRWRGTSDRPPLLYHGHLDVVPSGDAPWDYPPFAGEIADGCLWGRGAVDMKDSLAMTLAAVRARARAGRPPARDVVLTFVADEEFGGRIGARWLVDNRPELFADCTEAIGEVGGHSMTLTGGRRFYMVETAEKGVTWFRLTADGVAGHASMLSPGNPVGSLAETVARIERHRFPQHLTPALVMLLEAIAEENGVPFDPDDAETLVKDLGPAARMVGATLRDTAVPTILRAGTNTNVVPGQAFAEVDCRFLPGHREEFVREFDKLLGPGISRETTHDDIAVETPFEGPVVTAMAESITAEDPGGRVVPYLLPAGSDAKHFSRLGLNCFGFVPLRLPAGFDYPAMFHGLNERVPLDSLKFGARVMFDFFDRC